MKKLVDKTGQKRRSILLAVFLALVAIGVYVGFIYLNTMGRAG